MCVKSVYSQNCMVLYRGQQDIKFYNKLIYYILYNI